jgi:hypothetical protein
MKEMYLGTNKVDVPRTADSLTVGKDDDKIKLRDMNEMAYSDLIMAMELNKAGYVCF